MLCYGTNTLLNKNKNIQEAKQGKYVACLLESYMPSLKAPEHRSVYRYMLLFAEDSQRNLHSIQVQAIGALPTICKTVSAPTLKDFLDPIFERLLPLLNQTNDSRQKAILARLTLKVLADIANVTKATVSKVIHFITFSNSEKLTSRLVLHIHYATPSRKNTGLWHT